MKFLRHTEKAANSAKCEIEVKRLFEVFANDEGLSERWADLGITRRKGYQYLGVFCFLFVIYSTCILSFVRFLAAEPARGYGLGEVLKPLIGPSILSALPFGVLAYSDKTWRSSDSARVILGAWIAVYLGISVQQDNLCPMSVAIPLLPFILSAQIARAAGTLFQPRKLDDSK